MSNTNLPAIVTDLTGTELTKIKEFKDKGLPGIGEITDEQMNRMLELYLSGSSYSQISSILRVKRIYVTYFAHISDWYSLKESYLQELHERMKGDIVDAKLRNSEFMLLAIRAWQKKIKNNFTAYLATGNLEHMDRVSVKEMTLLMKAMEMISDWDETGKSKGNKQPAIGLNLGAGVIVEKTGNDQVTITPKEATVGSLLKRYKSSSQEALSNTSDINKNEDENDDKNGDDGDK